MAREIDCRGKPRYVHKQRVLGRVVSRVLGRGVVGQLALESILLQRQEIRELKSQEIELETHLDLYEKTVNQIIEQSLVGIGYICRQNVWQPVKRLNKPLTKQERAYIKRTKSIIKPICLISEPCATTPETQYFSDVLQIENFKNLDSKLDYELPSPCSLGGGR